RRILARLKARLPSDQHLALIFGEHDDDGIDAREMLGVASAALARPARADGNGAVAAIGAKAMARVPVDHTARAAIMGQLLRLQRALQIPDAGRQARAMGQFLLEDRDEDGP